MQITPDNQWIHDIRRQIQAALNDSKRDILREQFGMVHEHRSPNLSPEMESEWLDYILEFERQFENAPRITVRARVGDPAPPPLEAVDPGDLVAAVDALLELLAAHTINVEFLGEVDYETVYRYLTEELLDEEIDDIRIPDLWVNFIYATDTHNAETWVEQFVGAIFHHDLDQAQNCVDGQLWADSSGQPTTVGELEDLWEHMPVIRNFNLEVFESQIVDDTGQILCRITWPAGDTTQAIEAFFDVYRSRYLDEAWGVERTSLIDELRRVFY
jgi:hypothetical protein